MVKRLWKSLQKPFRNWTNYGRDHLWPLPLTLSDVIRSLYTSWLSPIFLQVSRHYPHLEQQCYQIIIGTLSHSHSLKVSTVYQSRTLYKLRTVEILTKMYLCAHHVFCSCCQQWLRYGLLSIKAFFANPLQAKVYYFQLSFFLQNCFAISPSSFCTVYLKQFCNNYTVNITDKRTDTSWDIFIT